MKCPFCESTEDKVLETRMIANSENIRRRRECLACGYRFTSYEHIEEKQLLVIKSDGSRQPFDLKKLEHGILRAIEKRPVPQEAVEEALIDIEHEARLLARTTHEVPSKELGELVLKKLYDLDKVAYVRFASVYRKFEDVDQFIKEIERLS